MTEFVDLQYRFKRNIEHENYMKYLINDAKLFQQYKDIMMLSALIGYENNLYEDINKSASDGVLMSFFSHDDRVIIDLLAYAHTKDQHILQSREKYHIFEKYYNGGFVALLQLLDLTENHLTIYDEEFFKELALKLYRIIISYQIQPDYLIDLE